MQYPLNVALISFIAVAKFSTNCPCSVRSELDSVANCLALSLLLTTNSALCFIIETIFCSEAKNSLKLEATAPHSSSLLMVKRCVKSPPPDAISAIAVSKSFEWHE